jgi:hypothetical protein
MATFDPKTLNFRNPAAPNLPLAPELYGRQYQDQFSNVLRLYFNQLDNAFASLLSPDGGKYLKFPYGAFHQDGTTTLSSSITNVSTTPISVASTTGFPASGWILIESELIQYTGTTSTTFTGITRGVLGTTNVAHTAGVAVAEAQGTGSPTTIAVMQLNSTDYSNTISISSTDATKIVFTDSGLYNLQFSVQLLNFTTTDDNVTLWLRKNGTDVSASAGIEQVNGKHGSAPGARIAAWNYVIDITANDYIQMAWTSDSGNTVVATYPAGTSPVHPVSPALILTATFVSRLPS